METIRDVVALYRKSYQDDESKSEEYRAACRAVRSLCDLVERREKEIQVLAMGEV